jgi:hypothetical protein
LLDQSGTLMWRGPPLASIDPPMSVTGGRKRPYVLLEEPGCGHVLVVPPLSFGGGGRDHLVQFWQFWLSVSQSGLAAPQNVGHCRCGRRCDWPGQGSAHFCGDVCGG